MADTIGLILPFATGIRQRLTAWATAGLICRGRTAA